MKRNRSGQIEFGLNWVGQILITIILIYVASLLVQNLALGDAQAESVARNIGVTFDVLATVPANMHIVDACPPGYVITIKSYSIIATKTGGLFPGHSAAYFYLFEKDSTRPDFFQVDCAVNKKIIIDKTVDINGKTTIEVSKV